MRLLKFILPVICALSLSACSGTWNGPKFTESSQLPPAPQGYTGQNKHGLVLKPAALAPAAPVESAALAPPPTVAAAENASVWHQLPNYDTSYRTVQEGMISPSLAPIGSSASAPQAMNYNDAVKVFPLDDDGVPMTAPVYTAAAQPSVRPDGRMAEQIFFRHASARIGRGDGKKLLTLAKSVRGENVSVIVVGHASARVDHVTDPVRRKMINLAMAQKRANAVTRALHRDGLKPSWVQAVSRGDEEPNPLPPPGMSQEAADRRAEVYVDDK